MIEIYKIEFHSHTNASKNTVYNKRKDEYLSISRPFLIKKSDIDEMEEYGDGIKSMVFIGYLF